MWQHCYRNSIHSINTRDKCFPTILPHYSWVEEFVGNPNHGHVALIDLIQDLADHPTSIPRKNTKKYGVIERDPVRSFKLNIPLLL